MFNNFRQNPPPRPKPQGEGCKMKVRNSGNTKTVEFTGNCSKEEKIEMLKGMNMGLNEEEED